jgi:hypothetical protein
VFVFDQPGLLLNFNDQDLESRGAILRAVVERQSQDVRLGFFTGKSTVF